MKHPPCITIYQDAAGQWRWRMQARNGLVIADSAEGYASKRNAVRAARTVIESATRAVVLS